MRLNKFAIVFSLLLACAPLGPLAQNAATARDKDKDAAAEIAAASALAPLQLTEAQFDIMHKMVDDVDHDLGHIEAEMNRRQEVMSYGSWGAMSDWGYNSWYPGDYDGYPGMMMDDALAGPPLPPRKDVLQKWMGELDGSIQSLSQQIQTVKLPDGTPSDVTVQVQVLQGIVPSLRGDYTKLSSLLNTTQYDRQAISVQTERIKDDVSGIDILRKRMHRLLKDDK